MIPILPSLILLLVLVLHYGNCAIDEEYQRSISVPEDNPESPEEIQYSKPSPANVNNWSKQEIHDESTTSVIIIMIFLAAILLLSAMGIGCSYFCYKRSASAVLKRKKSQLQQSRGDSHRQQVILHRPLEIKPLKRGIPNWYGPSPESPDDTRHLLPQHFVTIPTQLETRTRTTTTTARR